MAQSFVNEKRGPGSAFKDCNAEIQRIV